MPSLLSKTALDRQFATELTRQLVQTWHQTIPLSQFMQVDVVSFCPQIGQLEVTAPLTPNLNLHQTMFAGSIATLMTLTGWGLVWLKQQLAKVNGDIVLAESHIRYLAPVTSQPIAKVTWDNEIDLSLLSQGKRVKAYLQVELWCDKDGQQVCCAQFDGKYVSLPVT